MLQDGALQKVNKSWSSRPKLTLKESKTFPTKKSLLSVSAADRAMTMAFCM